MPKRARFEPVKKPEGWQVNVPASVTPDGKRVRKFFDTRDEARTFAEKLLVQYKNEGAAAFGLSSDQRITAVRAFGLLEEAGMTDLLAVVREGISALRLKMASRPLNEVFDRYIDSRRRSEIYTRSLRRSRRRLGALGENSVAEITAEMLEEHLLGAGPSYRNALLREIRAVFNYGVKKGWALKNPVDSIDFARLQVAEREIYPVEEAAALLGTAAKTCLEFLPFLAVGLFAGVRVYEMLRLNWQHIDLVEGVIDLPAQSTKKERRRFVRLEPTLDRWLRFALDQGVQANGRLVPSPTVDELKKQRRILTQASGISWKQNAMRHSYASYWLAEHRDLDLLALHMGHAGDLQILHRYYHRAVKIADSKSFWSLTPTADRGEVSIRDGSKQGYPQIWASTKAQSKA